MAWRLRLHTKSHYLDFEWGKQQQEIVELAVEGPTHTTDPMRADAEPRVGFRFTGPDEGFVQDI